MNRVRILQHSGVIPVIVFDGGRLPMKAGEEEERGRHVLRSSPCHLHAFQTLVNNLAEI
jgi:hypothetical protein